MCSSDLITGIAQTTEKFLNIKIGLYEFRDSYQQMSSSLDTLAKSYNGSGGNYTHMKQIITERYGADKLEKLLPIFTHKGHYPYEYMDGLDRFKETQLPPIDKFYSKLRNQTITRDEYAEALKNWDLLECKNLEDYHDAYLLADIGLLADIIEKYRSKCMELYQLDPLQYLTTCGHS